MALNLTWVLPIKTLMEWSLRRQKNPSKGLRCNFCSRMLGKQFALSARSLVSPLFKCLHSLCNWIVPFHWASGFFEKCVKCLWRKVGQARRLTLQLQKGDWTRWVSLPAEPTFCNLNGSPCFVKKCVNQRQIQGRQRGRKLTWKTIFLDLFSNFKKT